MIPALNIVLNYYDILTSQSSQHSPNDIPLVFLTLQFFFSSVDWVSKFVFKFAPHWLPRFYYTQMWASSEMSQISLLSSVSQNYWHYTQVLCRVNNILNASFWCFFLSTQFIHHISYHLAAFSSSITLLVWRGEIAIVFIICIIIIIIIVILMFC